MISSVTKALGNALDLPESSLASSVQRSQVAWSTPQEVSTASLLRVPARPIQGGVLTGSRVDYGIHHDLEEVLFGQQVDDLEAVLVLSEIE